MDRQDDELEVAFRFSGIDPLTVDLLRALLSRIEAEFEATRGLELPSDAWTFMLLTLRQSLTAGQQAFRLLAAGHPLLSLYMGRWLLEGYVAVLWAKGHQDETNEHFQNFLRSKKRLAGSWPRYGQMAGTLDDDGSHQDILRQIRRTQNMLFSHATSDYALDFGIEKFDTDGVVPAAGPSQREDLLHEATKHLMFLLGSTLLTAENIRRSLCGGEDSVETAGLIDEALVWTAYSPMEGVDLPSGDAGD